MNDAAVIQATFSDWRTVKGRKQLQLIFEVPLEKQAEVLNMLGAPMPEAEIWCAIAKLETKARGQVKPLFKQENTKLSFEAAMRCRDPQFQQFMGVSDEPTAAAMVREACHIDSRSGLNTDPVAASLWRGLDAKFLAWKQGVVA